MDRYQTKKEQDGNEAEITQAHETDVQQTPNRVPYSGELASVRVRVHRLRLCAAFNCLFYDK